MRKLAIYSPYPNVEISIDKLATISAALNSILSEFSDMVCCERTCGCNSSRKYEFAVRQRDELDALIDQIAATQPENISGPKCTGTSE
jgi:hypothetical protein